MVDNICAIATPYGTGAISIIRCSGPNSIELVNNINLILSYINTSSVTNMSSMFYGYKINDEIPF